MNKFSLKVTFGVVFAILFGFVHAPLMAEAMDMSMPSCDTECNITAPMDCVQHCIDESDAHEASNTLVVSAKNHTIVVLDIILIEPFVNDSVYNVSNFRHKTDEYSILTTQKRE